MSKSPLLIYSSYYHFTSEMLARKLPVYPSELAQPYLFNVAYKCLIMNTVDRYEIFPVASNNFS